ncbi:MAG TPA: efflux RND transporter periplasmic adaptor subunit [Phycisphaerae bacterium]|nr:efflux RND transporter periplasmic adaptor subunit [Phycisphaerae bacterium]
MKKSQYIFLVVIGFVASLVTGIWTGGHWNTLFAKRTVAARTVNDSAGTSTAPELLYTCSMHRQIILHHPGVCPICGMPLEVLHLATAHSANSAITQPQAIQIDPVMVQNMGVRVANVERGPLHVMVRAVGTFTEPEQNHFEVNLRVSGWIQKLYADREGMAVAKGDPLFELYSPEITAASDELISARKATDLVQKEGDETLKASTAAIVGGARRKLELLGLSTEQIDAIAAMDASPKSITYRSPLHGHITAKTVVEGSAVKAGDRIMRIADRSVMWLQVQVYEHDLSLVKEGMEVQVTVTAVPGKVFEGKVDFIYPHLDMESRTAMVRIVLSNEGHDLREGMFASAMFNATPAQEAVMVPREAVIDSGTRQIVFLSKGNGRFEAREVTVGLSGTADGQDAADRMVQVLSGLNGGETVVTSGQFLLDSESRLQEAIAKQDHNHMASPGDQPPKPETAGAISAKSDGVKGMQP